MKIFKMAEFVLAIVVPFFVVIALAKKRQTRAIRQLSDELVEDAVIKAE